MQRMFTYIFNPLVSILLTGSFSVTTVSGQTLEKSLLSESHELLAQAAQRDGDAKRGAVVFHQTSVGCAKCHSVAAESDSQSNRLPGPNLAELGRNSDAHDRHIVESILQPSAAISKGFETITVVDSKGNITTGLNATSDSDQHIAVRDAATSQVSQIRKADIDEVIEGKLSVMPAGVVNTLASRQQFLDLVKYVIEIRDGGPSRAKELQPAAALIAFQIPDYESRVDHAGLIRTLDDAAYDRGEAIYNRLCVNCHGTIEQPGSLPTALRFAEGKFRNGSTPFSMYQTLTHGFGLMVPQTWMVPRQKYDVIHYVREALVKERNPTQYSLVTGDWLASLPKGDTFGPDPVEWTPWSDMDYGPWMFNTVEVGRDASNIAYKGLAVRLDPGPGGVSRGNHWMLFDHDTMRVAAGWSHQQGAKSRFIDWQGIHFDGRHQVHPHAVGDVLFANPTGPGWADPLTGSFVDDQRVVGRDDRRYGPLPRRWSRYHGVHHSGDQVIVSYSVGDMQVKELFSQIAVSTSLTTGNAGAASRTEAQPVFIRTMQLSPTSQTQRLLVATDTRGLNQISRMTDRSVRFGLPRGADKQSETAASLAHDGEFNGTAWLQTNDSQAADTATRDFSITARIKTTEDGVIFAATTPGPRWVPNGTVLFIRGGRLTYDIGWVGAVHSKKQINDNKWHDVGLTWSARTGQVRLFVDGKNDGNGRLAPKSQLNDAIVRLGYGAPNFPESTAFKGTMQDTRFWGRLLSDDELRKPPAVDESLIAHWLPSSNPETAIGPALRVVHNSNAAASTGSNLTVGIEGDTSGFEFQQIESRLCLVIPASTKNRTLTVWIARDVDGSTAVDSIASQVADHVAVIKSDEPADQRWSENLTTTVQPGTQNENGFAVDILTAPEQNPWLARLRFSGLDFYDDNDRIAVCSWDGDVFVVSGLAQLNQAAVPTTLTWRRIASGLFQPLGLKIVDGQIYLTCRDQLVILRDTNQDGATDYFECFNNDQQVTEHFHEFAMGLQRDKAGNFYYAKSARHALTALVPHHGTLLKVSPDGYETKILANGFRAANGVCLNPDGSFIVTDQEGHWNPKNRINWVLPGRFYGNMFGYHEVTDEADSAMEQPLCWITNAFDRSPSELLWVNSRQWGNLNGTLLNLSYGYGKVYTVPHEHLSRPGSVQGGMCELPIPQFPTGTMRGRFHPADGQLYLCGLFAWGSSQQTKDGGLYRIRYAGSGAAMPVRNHASENALSITFSDALASDSITELSRYTFKVWALERSKNYGSKHIDEHEVAVTAARLSDDGHTLFLTIPDLKPTWCYELKCRLQPRDGIPAERIIHGTIHELD